MVEMRDSIIKSLIRWGRKTLVGDDTKIDKICQSESMGKTGTVVVIYPYGMNGNAPVDSTTLEFSVRGSVRDIAAFETMPENRRHSLKDTETVFGNPIRKSEIFFDENGNITLKAGIDNGTIRVQNENGYFELQDDGVVNVNGNLTVEP